MPATRRQITVPFKSASQQKHVQQLHAHLLYPHHCMCDRHFSAVHGLRSPCFCTSVFCLELLSITEAARLTDWRCAIPSSRGASHLSMTSVTGVPHAIKALYGQDAAQRQAANTWLTDFAASPQAWDCLQLLDSDSDAEVQFFSTNILLSKVRQSWHQLQPDMQAQISHYLRSALH